MKRKVTHLEAWADFYAWAKSPENWKRIDRTGRDRISKAQRRYTDGIPTPLGLEGVRSLLEQYGPPGRYDFQTQIFIRE